MSTTHDRLHTAYFPAEYADILKDVLAVTPGNFLNIKDALYHFRRLDDDQAAEVIEAIADLMEEAGDSGQPETDIHQLLAERRQIAHIWGIEDVQEVRPDLSEAQAWEVLQHVDHHKDAGLGITWLTLEMAAEMLFGDAPETDRGEA